MSRARVLIGPGYLLLCLLLGGASAGGYAANLILELIGIALLCWSILRGQPQLAPEARPLIALAVGAAGLIGLQLVPLPPPLWTALPGRWAVAHGFAMLGRPLPWLPLSLTPQATLFALVRLMPPFAIAAAMLLQGAFDRAWLMGAVLIAVAANILVGALQLAGGPGSAWYLYAVTNWGKAVGLFANGNHAATLLLAAIPLIAAVQAEGGARARWRRAGPALMLLCGAALGLVFMALLVNASLAGIALSIPVAIASAIILVRAGHSAPPRAALALFIAVGLVALAVLAGPIGRHLIAAKQAEGAESRPVVFARSAAAAAANLPFGTGLGSFQPIYRAREDPGQVSTTYMNHVHDDYIEIALEAGLPGLMLIAAFLIWWARTTAQLWRANRCSPIALASTIVSAVMLAHSLVDYPLRTSALACLFTACCALMAQERATLQRLSGQDQESRRLVIA